ncbi:hypothetical protein [Chelonobacter oris]|uniref:hypothetical protein n=2 Tax=Chelonobacter oris TaxID=505317 RepID=UPI001269EC8C|nr:hypothetical protein [Chelonobacter oris]
MRYWICLNDTNYKFCSAFNAYSFLSFVLNKNASVDFLSVVFFILGSISSFFVSEYLGYTISLICSGLGWASMFSGETFYLNEIEKGNVKNKNQGISSLVVYLCNLIASFSAGILLIDENGWYLVNIIALIISFIYYYIF